MMLAILIAIHFWSFVPDPIADFGLSRDITDDTYYTATSGKIPVKWTAPEVRISHLHLPSYTYLRASC